MFATVFRGLRGAPNATPINESPGSFRFACDNVDHAKLNEILKQSTASARDLNANVAYFNQLKRSPLLSDKVLLKVLMIYYLTHGECGSGDRRVQGNLTKNRIEFHKIRDEVVTLPLNLIEEMIQIVPFYTHKQLKGLSASLLPFVPGNPMGSPSANGSVPLVTLDELIEVIEQKIASESAKYGNRSVNRLPDYRDFNKVHSGTNVGSRILTRAMGITEGARLAYMAKAYFKQKDLEQLDMMCILYAYFKTQLARNSAHPLATSPIASEKYRKMIFILSFLLAFPTSNFFWFSPVYKEIMRLVKQNPNRVSSPVTFTYRSLYAFIMDYNHNVATKGIPKTYLHDVIGYNKRLESVGKDFHLSYFSNASAMNAINRPSTPLSFINEYINRESKKNMTNRGKKSSMNNNNNNNNNNYNRNRNSNASTVVGNRRSNNMRPSNASTIGNNRNNRNHRNNRNSMRPSNASTVMGNRQSNNA